MRDGRYKGLERFYLFSIKAKGTMGIYFVGFVFFYFGVGYLGGASRLSIDLAKTMQMTATCMAIGYSQAAIVPPEKFTAKRAAAWLTLSGAITAASTVFFGWFAGLPAYCPYLFCTATALGLAGYVLGLYFDARRETERLNMHLKAYQEKIGEADI